MLDFTEFLSKIKEFFKTLAETIYDVISDVFLFCFDMVMEAIIIMLDGLTSLMEFLDFSEYFQELPNEFIDAAGAIGLGQVFGIMLAGHGIKILLQLIPFVRLGAK